MSRRPQPAQRRADLARIHILKGEAGVSDEEYRQLVAAAGMGVLSSADLDDAGRAKLINLLEARREVKGRRYEGRPNNADQADRRELKKIEALLADAGRPWTYAVSILKRQTRGMKRRLEFADGRELANVIAALESDALRRLLAELHAELRQQGLTWLHGERLAILMGKPGGRDLEKSTQGMSEVLRYLRGQLAPYSVWPR